MVPVGGLKGRIKVVTVAFYPKRFKFLMVTDDLDAVYELFVARTGVERATRTWSHISMTGSACVAHWSATTENDNNV